MIIFADSRDQDRVPKTPLKNLCKMLVMKQGLFTGGRNSTITIIIKSRILFCFVFQKFKLK